MKQLLLMIILLLIIFGVLNGCSIIPEKNVYIKRGQIAEIAKPVRVKVWITNAETKKVELRTIDALAGWYVGRPKEVTNNE